MFKSAQLKAFNRLSYQLNFSTRCTQSNMLKYLKSQQYVINYSINFTQIVILNVLDEMCLFHHSLWDNVKELNTKHSIDCTQIVKFNVHDEIELTPLQSLWQPEWFTTQSTQWIALKSEKWTFLTWCTNFNILKRLQSPQYVNLKVLNSKYLIDCTQIVILKVRDEMCLLHHSLWDNLKVFNWKYSIDCTQIMQIDGDGMSAHSSALIPSPSKTPVIYLIETI